MWSQQWQNLMAKCLFDLRHRNNFETEKNPCIVCFAVLWWCDDRLSQVCVCASASSKSRQFRKIWLRLSVQGVTRVFAQWSGFGAIGNMHGPLKDAQQACETCLLQFRKTNFQKQWQTSSARKALFTTPRIMFVFGTVPEQYRSVQVVKYLWVPIGERRLLAKVIPRHSWVGARPVLSAEDACNGSNQNHQDDHHDDEAPKDSVSIPSFGKPSSIRIRLYLLNATFRVCIWSLQGVHCNWGARGDHVRSVTKSIRMWSSCINEQFHLARKECEVGWWGSVDVCMSLGDFRASLFFLTCDVGRRFLSLSWCYVHTGRTDLGRHSTGSLINASIEAKPLPLLSFFFFWSNEALSCETLPWKAKTTYGTHAYRLVQCWANRDTGAWIASPTTARHSGILESTYLPYL